MMAMHVMLATADAAGTTAAPVAASRAGSSTHKDLQSVANCVERESLDTHVATTPPCTPRDAPVATTRRAECGAPEVAWAAWPWLQPLQSAAGPQVAMQALACMRSSCMRASWPWPLPSLQDGAESARPSLHKCTASAPVPEQLAPACMHRAGGAARQDDTHAPPCMRWDVLDEASAALMRQVACTIGRILQENAQARSDRGGTPL
jgi:hypothetical protein